MKDFVFITGASGIGKTALPADWSILCCSKR